MARPASPTDRRRGKPAATTAVRHKHLELDQGQIDFAKRYFGVGSEQEAIERAQFMRRPGA